MAWIASVTLGEFMKRIICLLLIICLLGGCTTAPKEDKYNVVASFYPVMLITKMATEGIDEIEVNILAPADTGCLHDYVLLPDDLKNLEKADLFVTNGLGMESFINKITEQLPNLNTADLSQGIIPFNDNSHIWLTPSNVKVMLNNICEVLTKDLPQFGNKISANREKYQKMLDGLDGEIKKADFGGEKVITCHEAFDYFANQYNLTVVGTVMSEHGQEPSVKELVETTDMVKETGVKIILAEPQYETDTVKTVSQETGAEIYMLDPIVTGDKNDLPQVYFDKMRENTSTLIKAIRKD